jgi:anti-sigma B factor antagonist
MYPQSERELCQGPLKLTVTEVQSTHTLALCGELDLATVEILQTALEESRTAGAAVVIIDLELLEFIDSSGIACLVAAHREMNEDGLGCLRMVPSRALGVHRVLEVTGIEDRLPFIDDGKPRLSGQSR